MACLACRERSNIRAKVGAHGLVRMIISISRCYLVGSDLCVWVLGRFAWIGPGPEKSAPAPKSVPEDLLF